MGCALDTQDTFNLVLHNDSGKPEGHRPTLVFRYLSIRETKRVAKLLDEYNKFAIDENATVDDFYAKGLEAVKVACVGWKNYGKQFSLDALEDVLTPADLEEICNRWLREQSLTEWQKKASGSQSKGNTEQSVKSA
jgi:hypothetical protein